MIAWMVTHWVLSTVALAALLLALLAYRVGAAARAVDATSAGDPTPEDGVARGRDV